MTQRGQARARIGRARRTRHAGTVVRLAIPDDGIGGADPAGGSGLTGLCDRIEALSGTLDLNSPFGHGTALLIEIPV